MTLLEFVDNIATQAILRPEEFFVPGHNGPYLHPETAVRIKSHWLITFCKLYEWTGNPQYKAKAEEFAQFLLSKDARPKGYSFYHRNTQKKDQCNGLVGQAWTFEALAEAAKTFQEQTFVKVAEEVFLLHHFNETHALWNILEINGKILPIDNAPNHQLWFAAGMSRIPSDNNLVHLRINQFLDQFLENTTILDSGLIYHEYDFLPSDAYAKPHHVSIKTRFKYQCKQIMATFSRKQPQIVETSMISTLEKKEKLWDKMKNKSIGYHAFNMYALAMLKRAYPEHALWNQPTFHTMTSYLHSEEYQQGVMENQFSFPYNPPGIEVPFALSELESLDTNQSALLLEHWFRQQVTRTFNKKTQMFDNNTKDTTNLTARMYEMTRFERSILEQVNVYELNKNLTK